MGISTRDFEVFKRVASCCGSSQTLGKKFIQEFADSDARLSAIRDAQNGTKLAAIRQSIEACTNFTSLYWKPTANNLIHTAR